MTETALLHRPIEGPSTPGGLPAKPQLSTATTAFRALTG